MVEVDIAALEQKWQKRWKDAHAFEPSVQKGKEKFLATAPYPYVNGLPHVGHLFTYMRTEAFARYKRMRGYVTLYPQAWHCTGSPIVNAAKRVAEGDEKQLQILKDFGIAADELENFKKPEFWISYFAPKFTEDFQGLGMSVDWRRSFITTSLNPYYDKFIRWQFGILKQKGYVALGKHPVVWCPKESAPVSDHSRLSGEGETPQQFVLIPFKRVDAEEYVVCATLRPETIEGVTNLWANPALQYVRVLVDGMSWIVSEPCVEKLREQEHTLVVGEKISGESLIGISVTTPTNARVPVLPASFPTAEKGTGVVMSVPSDAPDDYIALRDLARDAKLLQKYSLDITNVKPIAIIDSGELGHLAAPKVVEEMKIANQKERDKLEAAKKLVYKKGFYEGKMLGGEYAGEKVEIAKERIKEALLASGHAIAFYELTGPVVCRCVTPCVVKIVQNQWFLQYSDATWKEHTHEALNEMRLYPEKTRAQFEYVLDWLKEWACTREEGLGTRLAWDEHWLIESLSDSTIYNAYYTISHLITSYPIDRVNDSFFDYVLLGKGVAPDAQAKAMREEFEYWYPVDFRNSGKDLIQNHLSFMLFNHTAIFPKEHWPRSFGLNGHVTVDGKKMSKSLGNVILVRTLLATYGADASRLTVLNGGEGLDDANWDTSLAAVTRQRIRTFIEFAAEWHGKGRADYRAVDDWFASTLNSTVKSATLAMEETQFRTALQHSWFSFTNLLRRYLKLSGNEPNKALLSQAIEAQVLMLAPFMPHACEEVWEHLGKHGFVSHAPWPAYDETKIKPELEASQDMIENLASDIRNVQSLLKIEKLQAVTIIVAHEWKFDLFENVRDALRESRDVREVLKAVLTQDRAKHAADITKVVPALVKDPGRIPLGELSQARELAAVEGAIEFLRSAFSAEISVVRAEDTKEHKASVAQPGKPAILLA